MAFLIQFRRNSSVDAAESNPVLAAGEPGFALDTHTLKVGDGVTAWNDLPSVGGGDVGQLAIVWDDLTEDVQQRITAGLTQAQADALYAAVGHTHSIGEVDGLSGQLDTIGSAVGDLGGRVDGLDAGLSAGGDRLDAHEAQLQSHAGRLDTLESAPSGGGGGAVDSVNGRTGAVELTAADVGLEGVQDALDGKVANKGGASGVWIGSASSLPTTGEAGVLYVVV
ncbi:minor tail protein [Gordonia phage Schmidt]|uniref:Minor tail protein n=1 Tax=Gordonia phage Schmidt TaxID=2301697 RepID=A0A385E2J2_9CAUD|nr:minor tail protein [Gordonia phage Schmidt]AXQ65147.1 minor tail protein [Gordonia phage Schmidt]